MKNSISSLKKIASIAGLFLGAFAISAIAATWTPPTAPPPSGNVDAPINAGTGDQGKAGRLAVGATAFRTGVQKLDIPGSALINDIVTNTLTITSNAGANKVLTSDANGVATWQVAQNTGTSSGIRIVSNPTSYALANSKNKFTYTFSGSEIPLGKAAVLVSANPPDDTRVSFYKTSDEALLGGVGGRVGGGEEFSDSGGQLILITENKSFKYSATQGGPAGNINLRVLAILPTYDTSIIASCSPSVTNTGDDQPVRWNSTVSGGNGSYTYRWDIGDNIFPTTQNHDVTHTWTGGVIHQGYHTAGRKYASLQVSSAGETVNVQCGHVDIVE